MKNNDRIINLKEENFTEIQNTIITAICSIFNKPITGGYMYYNVLQVANIIFLSLNAIMHILIVHFK